MIYGGGEIGKSKDDGSGSAREAEV